VSGYNLEPHNPFWPHLGLSPLWTMMQPTLSCLPSKWYKLQNGKMRTKRSKTRCTKTTSAFFHDNERTAVSLGLTSI
jgi:hypothetical protein